MSHLSLQQDHNKFFEKTLLVSEGGGEVMTILCKVAPVELPVKVRQVFERNNSFT